MAVPPPSLLSPYQWGVSPRPPRHGRPQTHLLGSFPAPRGGRRVGPHRSPPPVGVVGQAAGGTASHRCVVLNPLRIMRE